MNERPDLHELLGDEVDRDELRRLERAHDLLAAVGPLPELPPSLAEPPVVERERDASAAFAMLPRRAGRTLTFAAALAVMTLIIGYVVGSHRGGFKTDYTVSMHGTKAAPAASALIKVGNLDSVGNWPLEVEVRGLKPLPRGSYYELYLTKRSHGGRPELSCGAFRVHEGQTVVRLNAPFNFRTYKGWVVIVHHAGAPRPERTLLTT